MREHERIATFFAPLAASESGSFQLTDDAAVLTPPAGKRIVLTTDSVIESVHLPKGATAEQFAQKLIRRNLSDLAAMGATPWRYMLNVHLPKSIQEDWLKEFTATLASLQQHFNMVLVGGDSTSGGASIHLTATLLGLVETPLTRTGAKAGDSVYVTGRIGDAAMALRDLSRAPDMLLQRYYRPEPRVSTGQKLHGIATACIDVSDGLVQDLNHLCAASHVGASIDVHAIPFSLMGDIETMLMGGDDYELLFTSAVEPTGFDVPITRIGTIEAESGVRVLNYQGGLAGYSH